MMITLMIPPSSFLLDDRVFMSLGILRIAAVLEREGHAVEVLDLSGVGNYDDVVTARPWSLVGITATTPQMPAVAQIIAAIRRTSPEAKIVVGGPHVTMTHAAKHLPRATVAWQQLQDLADVLVAGDGEWAMLEAIQPESPKIINSDSPMSATFLSKTDLDLLPFPARHLVDVDSYQYTIDGTRALSLIAQLGCPFGCTFCGGRLSPSFRRVRLRSTGNIIAEVDALYRTYGTTAFMFYDDELNVNPKFIEFMRALRGWQEANHVQLKLRGFVKAELFTDEQAASMYAAGFRWLLCGFESGSRRILANINKRATVEDNSRCVVMARKHGLKVKALMSIGHAGDSPDTIWETAQWLLHARPDEFDCTVITPYPGTPYYDESQPTADGHWVYTSPKTGDRLYSRQVDYCREADYYKGIPGEYVAHVWTDALSATDLVEVRDQLEGRMREALDLPLMASPIVRQFEQTMGHALPSWIYKATSQEVT